MILIADSGSTKTDWCVVEHGVATHRLLTKGMNPFFQTEDEMAAEVAEALLPHLPTKRFEQVYFYGAGCAFPDKIEVVRRAVERHLQVDGTVSVNTDMLGAARGLCQAHPGIACILGTGSNSCYYDGREIVKNVSPLGFILGDEGSGACLGKLLVGEVLKNQWSEELCHRFFARFGYHAGDIIDRVYRQPFPNRFLAGLSPFLVENLHEPCVRELVLRSFCDFLRRNVMQYDYAAHEVSFVGSVAHYYREVLEEAARQTDIRLGQIVQSPMEGLIQYHSKA